MNSKYVNLDTLENKNGNGVENILRYVESAKLKMLLNSSDASDLEDIVYQIDRQLQDMSDFQSNEADVIILRANKTLNSVANLLPELSSTEELKFVKYLLFEISYILADANKRNLADILKKFGQLSLELAFMPKILPKNSLGSINFQYDEPIPKFRIGFESKNKEDFVDAEIRISNEEDSKSLYALWFFIETLQKIEAVRIEIKDIRKGSIFSSIRIWFKSEEAKQEVCHLLDSTRKFAKGKLEKDFSESEKIRIEGKKIEAEKEQIEIANSVEKSAFSEKKRELELESIAMDVERKKLENEKLRLELFLEKKTALKELLADEILSNEEFKLLVNNHLFLEKRKDHFAIGESMEKIVEK